MGYFRSSKTTGNESVTENSEVLKEIPFNPKIAWINVIFFATIHIFSIYGMYLAIFEGQLKTLIYGNIFFFILQLYLLK